MFLLHTCQNNAEFKNIYLQSERNESNVIAMWVWVMVANLSNTRSLSVLCCWRSRTFVMLSFIRKNHLVKSLVLWLEVSCCSQWHPVLRGSLPRLPYAHLACDVGGLYSMSEPFKALTTKKKNIQYQFIYWSLCTDQTTNTDRRMNQCLASVKLTCSII